MDNTILHDISYGMYVVTTFSGGKNYGCIANSFCQITSQDMVVSISLNKNNATNTAIKNSKVYALSIISEQTNPKVIQKFGFYSSNQVDKFDEFDYEKIKDMPVIKENCSGFLICQVFDIIETSTHDIFLAHIIDGKRYNQNKPMTYAYYHNEIKGKAPKNAPTYIEEQIQKTETPKHKCLLCGYVYDDANQNTPFENLPSDWQCPLCGANKAYFKEV